MRVGALGALGALAVSGAALAADVSDVPPVDLDALKAEYARPTSIPFPDDNPYTAEKADLGWRLFFDPRLSGSGAISCATCHNPGLGWEDGLALGVGHMGARLGRHTPTVLNVAWGALYFWDGRAGSLEDQAKGPIESEAEMNMAHDDAVARIASSEEYVELFDDAFPGEGVTIDGVAQAIATFERTLVSNEAPFDRWIAGDEDAIGEDAKRGFEVFNVQGNCAVCHMGWRFTDDGFHDIGVDSADRGRAAQMPIEITVLEHAFKTPTLRNIDRRAPYLHDGSSETLADVIELYDSGFVQRASLSPSIAPLGLTEGEKQDLLAFLATLTSEDDPIPVPPLPQ